MSEQAPSPSWAPPAWAIPLMYVLGGGVLGSGTTLSVERPGHDAEGCSESVEALASELSDCQMAVYRCAASTELEPQHGLDIE